MPRKSRRGRRWDRSPGPRVVHPHAATTSTGTATTSPATPVPERREPPQTAAPARPVSPAQSASKTTPLLAKELRRILLLSGLMFAIVVVLYFFLR